MITTIRNAVMSLLVLTILTGLIYPLVVTGVAQTLFPVQANGSIVMQDGRPIGSLLVGQQFDAPMYFWGRPSATVPYPYNGRASSGSNLGPNNPDLAKALKQRVDALRKADPDNTSMIPVDLVTASGSGLDPHISPAAAAYQAKRVAGQRKMDMETVLALVGANTEPRQWGILGEPVVNVLKLNMDLDELEQK